jgi:hypothetical protein
MPSGDETMDPTDGYGRFADRYAALIRNGEIGPFSP